MRKPEKKILALVLGMGIVLTEPGAIIHGNHVVMAESEIEERQQAEFTFDEKTGCLTFFGNGAIIGNPEEASNDAGMKYMDIGEWKKSVDMYEVKSVVIQEGVTEIGESAFSYIINAKKVTIAGSVKKIGAGAFGGCDNLTEVIIEDGSDDSVTEIGNSAFAGVPVMKVTIAASVEVLVAGAFQSCDKLKRVTFAEDSRCLRTEEYYRYFGDEV